MSPFDHDIRDEPVPMTEKDDNGIALRSEGPLRRPLRRGVRKQEDMMTKRGEDSMESARPAR